MKYYDNAYHFDPSVEQVTTKAKKIIDSAVLAADNEGKHVTPETFIHFLPSKVQIELNQLGDEGLAIRNMIYAVLSAEVLTGRGYSTKIRMDSTLAEIEHAIKRSPCLELKV